LTLRYKKINWICWHAQWGGYTVSDQRGYGTTRAWGPQRKSWKNWCSHKIWARITVLWTKPGPGPTHI